MNENGGLGDVVPGQKNIVLFDSNSEKMCAVPHANGTDIWAIGRHYWQPTYYAYHISATGIVDTVISNTNEVHNQVLVGNGYLIVNHAGDKIVNVHAEGWDETYILDFDRATGSLTVNTTLGSNVIENYGGAFSPNDSYLYITCYGDFAWQSQGVWQFDMNAANISASGIHLRELETWGMMEGPDGKIYITGSDVEFQGNSIHYLKSINNPNLPGALCDYQDSALYLGGKRSQLGLPNNFPAVYDIFSPEQKICAGQTATFTIKTAMADSERWDFGDPSSGANNTSSLVSPEHIYTEPGQYDFSVTKYLNGNADELEGNVDVAVQSSSVLLGPDTALCENDTLFYDFSGQQSFLWEDGTTSATRIITEPGSYSLTVTGFCGTYTDQLVVTTKECEPSEMDEYSSESMNKISVYPNPGRAGQVMVKNILKEPLEAEVINSLGQRVCSIQIPPKSETTVNNLPAGVYYLRSSNASLEVLAFVVLD